MHPTEEALAASTNEPIVAQPRPPRRRLVVLAVILILLASAGLRLWNLGQPTQYMFDEVYYAKDARAIVEGRVGTDGPLRWAAGDAVSWPHPEAGKLAIAAGILLFGDRAIGWRLPAVAAGLVMLACVYPLARRLGLSAPWALLALLFAAADPLGIVQSRIATLDVFVAMWTVVCLLLALRYVQDGRSPLWLALCGVAGGLALATKWSGALALFAAALIVLGAWVWERRHMTADTEDESAAPAEGRLAGLSSRVVLPIIAGLVLVPAIVYMATFAQYFVKGHTLADWWELHRQMYIFGLNLRAEHTYASIAPSWIVNYRPVWYYFSSGADYRGVVAIGNPFLWWAAALALLAAPLVALRRATWMLVPAALVAVLYLPWFATSRTSFLYYMTPVAPFMAILVAAALADYAGRVRPRLSHWLVAAGVAAATALLWRPVGRLAEWLLWQLPRQAHPLLGWVAVAAVAFVALLGLFYLASGRMRRTRPMTAMVASGLIVGIVAAFIPVLLAIPISQEHFYRITWFSSWI